jgi:hypothetical protein
VLLYEDEASLYKQPSQAPLFTVRGRLQPRLPMASGPNTVMRIAGFLNAGSGAVHFWDGSKITAGKIARCMKEISAVYPEARKIYIVMDNWPVHFHEKVQKAVQADPRIQVLRLPTYAPWLNPIEKLWRLTKQRVVHAHTLSNDFNRFKQLVRDFLAKPTEEPQTLLRYVGLLS